MTRKSDVIVIGGGVIGLSIADRLARNGVKVTLLERGRCGRESSWAAAGVLKPSNPNRRGAMQQIQRAGLEMFPDYCADLQERTGIDPQYTRCGSIELLFDDQRHRMALSEQRAAQTTPDGRPEWEVLTTDDAHQIEPAIGGECLAALLCRFSAQVRNPRLLQALVAVCQAVGVDLREETAATELLVEQDRITGVATSDGPFMAPKVVLCAGAWSSQIDQRVGPAIPTYPVRGQVVLLDASLVTAAKFSHIIDRKGCYLVPRSDGLVLIGATVEHQAGFDRRNTPAGVAQLIGDGLTLVPALADAGVAALWSGFRPGTPDRRPYIGFVPGMDGLIAATGHYRTGLALAPVTAEIVTGLVLKGSSPRDLSRCQPGRAT